MADRDGRKESVSLGGNPGKRRKIFHVGEFHSSPLPPAKTVVAALNKKLQADPDLKEQVIGTEVAVADVSIRRVLRDEETNEYYVDTQSYHKTVTGNIFNPRTTYKKHLEMLATRGLLVAGDSLDYNYIFAFGWMALHVVHFRCCEELQI